MSDEPAAPGFRFGRAETVVLLVVVALACGWLATARPQMKVGRTKCSSNLRQVGLGLIQYADDKGAFPHLGPLERLDGATTPKGSGVPGRALEAIVYFGYVDNPEVFICPQSRDTHFPMTEATKVDQTRWQFGGMEDPARANPIVVDPGYRFDEMTDLSYGYTVKGLTVNAPVATPLSSDKARGATQHLDGWNVLHVDAHVSFVRAGQPDATRLSTTNPGDGFLVVWDDTNGAAGGR